MDVDNRTLQQLMDKTDQAFQALMKDPASTDLNLNYEEAKVALDEYIANMRQSIEKRCKGF